ncbi:MAG: hypothetical protein LBR08_06515 [Bacteroidales bacterium]|nr:hypothetical protein [Bacteroidales bacterium]
MIFYINGNAYDAKEEELPGLDALNEAFRGFYFIFTDNTLSAGMGNDVSPWGAYTASGDKITLQSGGAPMIMQYRLAGKNLDLTITRDMFELSMGALPDVYYEFDDLEFILSYTKVD